MIILQSFTVIAKNTNYIKNSTKSIQKTSVRSFFAIPPHPKPPGKNGIFRFPDNPFLERSTE
jgi:hypothetical protein